MPETTLNPSACPLCGKLNLCAMEVERATGQKQGPCWCTTAQFDAALLARIPSEKRNLTCVCADCAQEKG
ncbi:MAG: cysteine-rich CWC family protein [Burkholderiaceae bacterium]|nr:cysteine-rich CWC family protein [Burkholderiaceae bacterium]